MRYASGAAIVCITLVLSVICDVADASGAWHQATAPLMTRWAKDVTPQNALAEYPRPQMVRARWQNLNGLWDYAITPIESDQAPRDWTAQILVPFPIESALSGVMKPLLPKDRLWYHRSFRVPADWAGQHVLLHFDAVDYDATVYLNGKKLGAHQGGYDRFSFDITDSIEAGAMEDLLVSVVDPSNTGEQAHGKQTLHPGGASYTATSGIWQTVWLEPVPQSSIADVKITPDVDGSAVRLIVDQVGDQDPVTVSVMTNGNVVSDAEGQAGHEIVIPIKNPRLWSPDDPFLYDLKITLKGKTEDEISSYFGMRKITIGPDSRGVPRMLLNGKFVFERGPLDQGFWPDGLYTAPTDDALKYDLEYCKSIGFNMVRKHVKIEPQRWYYWADKLGILVWQDMPAGEHRTSDSRIQWETEMQRHIENHFNHPSIIMWVIFNEGWGEYDTGRLAARIRALDGTRLIDDASGWYHKGWGDVIDQHFYPGPGVPELEEKRASVIGEFGGLGYITPQHMWKAKAWGYQSFTDTDTLTNEYERLWRRVYRLKDEKGLSAAVFTQISDIEEEANGLMTYDRAIEKMEKSRVRAASSGELQPAAYKVLIPTSRNEPQIWNISKTKPAPDWAAAEFDDSSWIKSAGGFGTKYGMEHLARTVWEGSDLWIRHDFTVDADGVQWPVLEIYYGADLDVYINGTLACRPEGFLNCYGLYDLNPAARATIKPGRNTIAVHLIQRNKGGRQYIDVGLSDEITRSN